jgi:hypothetical protein
MALVNFKAKGFEATAVGVQSSFSGPVALNGGGTSITPATNDNSTAIATTEFVKAQNYLSASSPITLSGDVSGSGYPAITTSLATIAGLPTAVIGSGSAIPVIQVDTKGRVVSLSSTAVSVAWSGISGAPTTLAGYGITDGVSLSGATFTGAVILHANPITALGAATKQYVDDSISAAITGLLPKQSVLVATTGPITLSGLQTIDGQAVNENDRVLVKDQLDASTNGIYVAHASAWVRASDADTNTEVRSGMYMYVQKGTANAGSAWVLSTVDPIVVGTTELVFVHFNTSTGGGGSYTNGAGLSLSGNTFSITDTGVTAAAYGSATKIPTFTVNSRGQLTAAGSVDLTPDWSVIQNKPTTISGYGITDAVSVAGGTFTGTIGAPQLNYQHAATSSATVTSSAVGTGTLMAAQASSVRAIKLTVQISQGTNFEACELLVLHNDVTPYVAEYARITPNSPSGISFDANISAGVLSVTYTAISSSVTVIKAIYHLINS